MTSHIQLGNLTKLAKEDQWHFWLEDLRGIMFLNGLQNYFNNTAMGIRLQNGQVPKDYEVQSLNSSRWKPATRMRPTDKSDNSGYNFVPESYWPQQPSLT